MTDYEVSRSAVLPGDIGRVHALLSDFHEWPSWSPWEELDPDMTRTYSGAESGVGARYAWSGNKRAGAGAMEITESTPEHIGVALEFLKPFKSQSTISFDLTTVADGTQLRWTHNGSVGGVMALMTRFYSMEKAIGPDMEKGLAKLATVAAGPNPIA
ncbi:SRPBCC family protein [Nocardioides sp. NPDC057577]|uniref:SRPBCC family protein n=1 Tax=Nocardioides sp. NPDC057577 TaxID=3346171 RepID=UPI003670A7A9